jgi:catechol 2,3-dioxygenase-like lactoylglutathione lyase family enzyme
MNTKPQFGFVIEYVKDIDAARRFYVEVLGLEIEREHPTYPSFVTLEALKSHSIDRTSLAQSIGRSIANSSNFHPPQF